MSYSFGWIEIHCVDHCNNDCTYCNNHSPYSPKRVYSSEEYQPWIDTLLDWGVQFYCLSIMGGEPFLHPDLAGFMRPLRQKYPHSLMVTTNGFWLGAKDVSRYDAVFEQADILIVSLYPNMKPSYGSLEEATEKLKMVEARHPHLRTEIREIDSFVEIPFSEASLKVDRYCGVADCTVLLADGRLARCGVGAYAHWNPKVSQAFLAAEDLFFDLKHPKEDFWLWRKRYPLNVCQFCGHFQAKRIPWEYTRRIPPKKGSEELERLRRRK
jgi:hypothetical protein